MIISIAHTVINDIAKTSNAPIEGQGARAAVKNPRMDMAVNVIPNVRFSGLTRNAIPRIRIETPIKTKNSSETNRCGYVPSGKRAIKSRWIDPRRNREEARAVNFPLKYIKR